MEEAVDSKREETRESLNEPYRTLLGHLRHESGHYYWDHLISPHLLDPFRELFGDERADYSEALKKHYDQGPSTQWDESFVSAYASAHPWEDWAETWAHYLNMRDTMDTWLRYGLRPADALPYDKFSADALLPGAKDEDGFLELVNGWVRLTPVLNELSASMGFADFYPFVLSTKVVQKFHFVHRAIGRAAKAANQPQEDRRTTNAFPPEAAAEATDEAQGTGSHQPSTKASQKKRTNPSQTAA
ncbi:MAG TPA: putative zinc-binding metallopeptidase [Terriglobales bacterium]|nr:putative zinc-binding metallopeptidase [Terriglobales bacterium]